MKEAQGKQGVGEEIYYMLYIRRCMIPECLKLKSSTDSSQIVKDPIDERLSGTSIDGFFLAQG